MSVASTARLVIDRRGVVTALVTTAPAAGPEDQFRIATAVVDHWHRVGWPPGLVSVSCFCNIDGGSVLVYQQWSDIEAAHQALRDPTGICRVPGVEAQPPVEYRLYRTVPGNGVSNPPPPVVCFPVAFFIVESGESGRAKIDEMLAAEEAKAGTRREYPGGVAAHMHVSADDRSVFVFSEWASVEEHTAHLEDLWEDLLAEGGHRALEAGKPPTGDRYHHYATKTAVHE
ncbi:hypothetical protein [Nocardia sp. NPDC004860]|uniref:putative quinol monooxygenase n=1 Tax=Nocardia sp. NPDC004860 TaxID=3154557 RepID=UPI0033BA6FEC